MPVKDFHQRKYLGMVISITLTLLISACDKKDTPHYQPSFGDQPHNSLQQYIIGVHPLHNPQRLHQVFAPLAKKLSAEIPTAQFKIEASRNYASFNQKLQNKDFDFAIPNPYQTLNALSVGYRVIAKMGDDEKFRGIFLVRKDSGISEPIDLRGKKVSFPAPTALAATIMPQKLLHDFGLDISQDIETIYVGSQESSIMSVFLNEVAAGASWSQPWNRLRLERPELAQALTVKWQTSSLPNNSLIAKETLPNTLIMAVQSAVIELHTSEAGMDILKAMDLSKFEKANNKTYLPVREFLYDFSKKVRPLQLDGI